MMSEDEKEIEKPKIISIIKEQKGKRLSIIKKLKKLRSTSCSISSIGKKKQDKTSKNNGEKLVDFFSFQALRSQALRSQALWHSQFVRNL